MFMLNDGMRCHRDNRLVAQPALSAQETAVGRNFTPTVKAFRQITEQLRVTPA
jgi:hypothetical protein